MSKEEVEAIIKKKTAIDIDHLIREVETILAINNGDFIDAIITYSEINSIEIETIAAIIKSNSKLKNKLKAEAERLNLLAKESKNITF